MKDKLRLILTTCLIFLMGFFCTLRLPIPINPDHDDPTLLDAPILSKPAQAVSINPLDLLFEWHPVTGAEKYLLTIALTDSLFLDLSRMLLITCTDTTRHRIEDSQIKAKLQNDSTYFWRVRSIDPSGEWSETWHFTVDTRGPATPTLLAPKNETLIKVNMPDFRWSDGAAGYRIVLDDNPDFLSPLIDEDT